MNIHLWNTCAIVNDLRNRRVSEGDSCTYLIAILLLGVGESYLGIFVVPPIEWFLLYEIFVVVTVTVFGIRACFRANGGTTGKDFILRFTCISLPISLKLALVGWVLIFVIYRYPETILDSQVFVDPERAWRAITICWLTAFSAVFYWRVWHHLRLVNDPQPVVAADA